MTEIIVAVIVVGLVSVFTTFILNLLETILPTGILIFITLAIAIRTILFIIHRK